MKACNKKLNRNDVVIVQVYAGMAEVLSAPEHCKTIVIDYDVSNGDEYICPACGASYKLAEGKIPEICPECEFPLQNPLSCFD